MVHDQSGAATQIENHSPKPGLPDRNKRLLPNSLQIIAKFSLQISRLKLFRLVFSWKIYRFSTFRNYF